jgi:hypothetical protein
MSNTLFMNPTILTRFSILFVLIAGGVLGTAFQPAPLEPTYDLRYKFNKGDKFRYEFSTEQSIIQTIQGREELVDQKIRFSYLYEIQKASGNQFEMKVSYENVYHSVSNPRIGNLVFDSENPGEEIPELSMGFAGLVGQSFVLNMDDRGKVLSVKGIDGMLEGIIETLEAELGEGLGAEVREAMGKQFSAETLSRDMENQMAIFPNHPVKIGDKWTLESSLQSMVSMNIVSHYTLKKVEGGKAFIAVESDLETEEGTQNISGMPMNYNMGGTQDGTIEVRLKNGVLTESNLVQNINGEVSAQGMNWPIMIEADIVLKLEN